MTGPDASAVPTSVSLAGLLADAPADAVTLDWIMERLDERSFGVVMLLLALMALVPGLSPIAALLVAWPATQMILARPRPTLPGFVARRAIATARLARLIRRAVPVLRWLERFVRPRWRTPFAATRRVLGGMLLLLGLSLASPVPFSHIPPALAIMAVAFAYLEGDGVMLALALLAAIASLAATAFAGWAAIYGIGVLERL